MDDCRRFQLPSCLRVVADKVIELKKTLYGLKQAGFNSQEKLVTKVILGSFVSDFLIFVPTEKGVDNFKLQTSQQRTIQDLGEAEWILRYFSGFTQPGIRVAYCKAVRQIAAKHPDTVKLVDLWKVFMDTAIAMMPGLRPQQRGRGPGRHRRRRARVHEGAAARRPAMVRETMSTYINRRPLGYDTTQQMPDLIHQRGQRRGQLLNVWEAMNSNVEPRIL
ncbi:hypothetical protein B0H63DRAFT_536734 [Podospora didyma]|uniref:Uncharacterized protein n=1 Tax=Podospora didyma TaxID=330526 RepID=A0AAE0JY79_9PEZI|nr:hypothetical protein B0H63DRAFT_536734 [Podospora didyma]